MQTIDLTNGKGYKVIKFPDGELHLELEELNRKDSVSIKCRITGGNDIFLLMQLSDIVKRQCIDVQEFHIYYLMGMRCDRLFDLNRPFTLGIVSDIINSFSAEIVYIYEPHSGRTLKEIKNSCEVPCTQIYAEDMLATKNYVLVAPDKGAKDRYKTLDFGVICSKERDFATGNLLKFSVEPQTDVEGKDLLVIDDLCDGGGTFIGLAEKLRDLKPKSLSLLVTHAVQKQGIDKVLSVYDYVYITDTYTDWTQYQYNGNLVIKPITQPVLKAENTQCNHGEHIVDATKSATDIKLQKGEMIICSNDIKTIEKGCGVVCSFLAAQNNMVYGKGHDVTNAWGFCLPISKFNADNIEDNRKEILKVKNEKIVKAHSL